MGYYVSDLLWDADNSLTREQIATILRILFGGDDPRTKYVQVKVDDEITYPPGVDNP